MAASDHLGPQFGNNRSPGGSDYYPKHAGNALVSDDPGEHAGRRKRGRDTDDFHNPQHSTGDSGYVGKHASDRKSRIGAVLKGARKMIRGHA